jgi:hypothetical protein
VEVLPGTDKVCVHCIMCEHDTLHINSWWQTQGQSLKDQTPSPHWCGWYLRNTHCVLSLWMLQIMYLFILSLGHVYTEPVLIIAYVQNSWCSSVIRTMSVITSVLMVLFLTILSMKQCMYMEPYMCRYSRYVNVNSHCWFMSYWLYKPYSCCCWCLDMGTSFI